MILGKFKSVLGWKYVKLIFTVFRMPFLLAHYLVEREEG